MRLLVVMNKFPYPLVTGSSVVAYNSLKYLSKWHVIHLICFNSSTKNITPLDFVGRIDLITNNKRNYMFTKRIRYYYYMLLGIPSSVSEYTSLSMKRKVRKSLDSEKYDAILLFEMSAIQHIPHSSYHKLIVNIEDPQSIRLRRMSELPIWTLWQRIKFYIRIRLTASYENRVLHKLAGVLLLSKSDVHDMQNQGAYRNLSYIPYAVDKRNSAAIMNYEDREKIIIFSGSMFHPSNIDGAIFLLRDVYPLILKEYPSAKLLIVGANPDKRIYKAAAEFGEQVVITGRVDDISSYIRRASVSICPVRLKIGVQTKILEALSWGTPVVTTNAGNSGINGVSGTHLWVEDDPYFLAKRVSELLKGRNWAKLSAEGRMLVKEHFSWEISSIQLHKYLGTIAKTNS